VNLLYGVILGLCVGAVTGYFMAKWAYAGPRAEHRLADVGCEIEFHDWGKDHQPVEMRWRYVVRQAGVPESMPPLTLGNAPTKKAAKKAALDWISLCRQQVTSGALYEMARLIV
jgi:hypothetical protein